MKDEIDKIKKLIAVDKIEEALDKLLNFEAIDNKYVNEVILNSSKLYEINSLERKGVVERKNVAIEKSQIRLALLQIIDELGKGNSTKDTDDIADNLYSKAPLEVLSSLNGEKVSINNQLNDVLKNVEGDKRKRKIEKIKFLYNSLSERRLLAIKNRNLLLAKDITTEIFTVLSIFEDDFKNEAKDFSSFNVIVSGRLLASQVAGVTGVGSTITGVFEGLFTFGGAVGYAGGIASKAMAIITWTKSEHELVIKSKKQRIKRIRKIIEE